MGVIAELGVIRAELVRCCIVGSIKKVERVRGVEV